MLKSSHYTAAPHLIRLRWHSWGFSNPPNPLKLVSSCLDEGLAMYHNIYIILPNLWCWNHHITQQPLAWLGCGEIPGCLQTLQIHLKLFQVVWIRGWPCIIIYLLFYTISCVKIIPLHGSPWPDQAEVTFLGVFEPSKSTDNAFKLFGW